MFDWNDLRYFVAVAEHGSTLAAARALKVNQSTVARRIAALEVALAAPLFERRPSGYLLTDAGQEFLGHAVQVQAHVNALASSAAARGRTVKGVVRITVEDIYAVAILAPILVEMRQAYPSIRVELDTTGEVRNLAEGEADVAIRSCVAPDEPGLVGRRLFPDNFGFYCSVGYAAANGSPSDPEELGSHAIVAGGGGTIGQTYSRWLKKRGLEAAVVLEFGSATGLLSAVKSGLGIAALPRIVADREPDLQLCYPPLADNSSSLWLVTHERLRWLPHVRSVLDFLYKRMKGLGSRTGRSISPNAA